MLYDPRWEKKIETKADPFSLGSLIAWLTEQPAQKSYEYFHCGGECLYGQYMRSIGISWEEARYCGAPGRPDIHRGFREMVYFPIAHNEPHTFGAALERARAAHSSTV